MERKRKDTFKFRARARLCGRRERGRRTLYRGLKRGTAIEEESVEGKYKEVEEEEEEDSSRWCGIYRSSTGWINVAKYIVIARTLSRSRRSR